MSHFRIETVSDPATGMICAEAFSEPGASLIVRSEPIFKTHGEAEEAIISMIKRAWPDRNPEALDASIGV